MRFLFISDTHAGAAAMGYCQQPGYPARLPELLRLLDAWRQTHGPVDFVLHGGDLLDRCEPALIAAAARDCRLSVPLWLCLGNHDLTAPDAATQWRAHGASFFAGGDLHFTVVRPEAVLHVVPCHWEAHEFFWQATQDPRLSAAQVACVEATLAAYPDRPHVLCTHAPVCGIPPGQTGRDAPAHESPPAFREQILALCRRHPALRLVLGGHSHVNTLVRVDAVFALTASAFVETPFEFKVITIERGRIEVRTENLYDAVAFRPAYNFDHAFVQGRPCDRAGVLEWLPAPAAAAPAVANLGVSP